MREKSFVEIGSEDSLFKKQFSGFIKKRGCVCKLRYQRNPAVLLDGFKESRTLFAKAQNTGVGERIRGSPDSKEKVKKSSLDSCMGQLLCLQKRYKLRETLIGISVFQDSLRQLR